MKKALAKRIRITRNGKIIRRHMGQGHNGTRHSRKQKHRASGSATLHKADTRLITQSLIRNMHFRKATRPNKSN